MTSTRCETCGSRLPIFGTHDLDDCIDVLKHDLDEALQKLEYIKAEVDFAEERSFEDAQWNAVADIRKIVYDKPYEPLE